MRKAVQYKKDKNHRLHNNKRDRVKFIINIKEIENYELIQKTIQYDNF